mmetsp:Transcript_101733/g.283277  ORF Transcript_101733/g.283277 Transcript_101733/m.283277 type:complete len:234 (+) Transcript_101733:459-1160(+)
MACSSVLGPSRRWRRTRCAPRPAPRPDRPCQRCSWTSWRPLALPCSAPPLARTSPRACRCELWRASWHSCAGGWLPMTQRRSWLQGASVAFRWTTVHAFLPRHWRSCWRPRWRMRPWPGGQRCPRSWAASSRASCPMTPKPTSHSAAPTSWRWPAAAGRPCSRAAAAARWTHREWPRSAQLRAHRGARGSGAEAALALRLAPAARLVLQYRCRRTAQAVLPPADSEARAIFEL